MIKTGTEGNLGSHILKHIFELTNRCVNIQAQPPTYTHTTFDNVLATTPHKQHQWKFSLHLALSSYRSNRSMIMDNGLY